MFCRHRSRAYARLGVSDPLVIRGKQRAASSSSNTTNDAGARAQPTTTGAGQGWLCRNWETSRGDRAVAAASTMSPVGWWGTSNGAHTTVRNSTERTHGAAPPARRPRRRGGRAGTHTRALAHLPTAAALSCVLRRFEKGCCGARGASAVSHRHRHRHSTGRRAGAAIIVTMT
jgi:hypothetical protein